MIRAHTTGELTSLQAALLVFAVVGIGLIGGCDGTGTSSSTEADASSESPDDVVLESDAFTQTDLQFEPVSASAGESIVISLVDGESDQNVARIIHEGTSDGRQSVTADFGRLDPESVSIECQNRTENTTQKMRALQKGEWNAKEEIHSVARTRDGPSSYHYRDTGDNVIVTVDYGGTSPGTTVSFPFADDPVECTDVAFTLEGVSAAVVPDGVQFDGLDEAPTFRQRQFQ